MHALAARSRMQTGSGGAIELGPLGRQDALHALHALHAHALPLTTTAIAVVTGHPQLRSRFWVLSYNFQSPCPPEQHASLQTAIT